MRTFSALCAGIPAACRTPFAALRRPPPARSPALLRAVLALAAAFAAGSPAEAGWFNRLVQSAGKTGAAGAKAGAGALGTAGAYVAKLPASAKSIPLAAHALSEGHWQFANRAGDVFTAGTRDELARAASVLAPSAEADSRLALYLSEETVFRHPGELAGLPAHADLYIVAERSAYRLVRRGGGTAEAARLYAEIRPNVLVEPGNASLFKEAVFQLSRPLDPARLRVLSLEPGGPAAIPALPRFDRETGLAAIDSLDPGYLPSALSRLRGQTVLVTGRIAGPRLHVLPPRGGEHVLDLEPAARAAGEADAGLVVLDAPTPVQPGGRNWLWQKMEVAGLNEALHRPAFADFLDTLGANLGRFTVTVTERSPDRTVLRAEPVTGARTAPQPDSLSAWLDHAVSQVTGEIVAAAVEADLVSKARQEELDLRLIPFVPFVWQALYLGGFAAGLMGFGTARSWWAGLWPPERREEYGGVWGYGTARAVRSLAFLLLFLPLAGAPAFLAGIVLQIRAAVTAPVLLLRLWWDRLWPSGEGEVNPDDGGREDDRNASPEPADGSRAMRLARLAVFLFAFLPLALVPAVCAAILLGLWAAVQSLAEGVRGLVARLMPVPRK